MANCKENQHDTTVTGGKIIWSVKNVISDMSVLNQLMEYMIA